MQQLEQEDFFSGWFDPRAAELQQRLVGSFVLHQHSCKCVSVRPPPAAETHLGNAASVKPVDGRSQRRSAERKKELGRHLTLEEGRSFPSDRVLSARAMSTANTDRGGRGTKTSKDQKKVRGRHRPIVSTHLNSFSLNYPSRLFRLNNCQIIYLVVLLLKLFVDF